MTKAGKRKESLDNRIFNSIVNLLLILFGLLALYPLLFVLVASISDPVSVNSGDVWLYPVGFQLDGYKSVFKNKWVFIGYRNSLIYTVLGTALNVLVTVMAGYALSRKDLVGKAAQLVHRHSHVVRGRANPHICGDQQAASGEYAVCAPGAGTGEQLQYHYLPDVHLLVAL